MKTIRIFLAVSPPPLALGAVVAFAAQVPLGHAASPSGSAAAPSTARPDSSSSSRLDRAYQKRMSCQTAAVLPHAQEGQGARSFVRLQNATAKLTLQTTSANARSQLLDACPGGP